MMEPVTEEPSIFSSLKDSTQRLESHLLEILQLLISWIMLRVELDGLQDLPDSMILTFIKQSSVILALWIHSYINPCSVCLQDL